MKILRRSFSDMSLRQRLLSVALTWGVPMLLVDLIGAPRRYWVAIALFGLPGTLAGVLVYTLLEHMVFSRKGKTKETSGSAD